MTPNKPITELNTINDPVEATIPSTGRTNKDGTPDKRFASYKTTDPTAPYGYLKDGITPRKRPGRKPTTAKN